MPEDNHQDAERPTDDGQSRGQAPSETELVFTFNGSTYSLPCRELADKSLREILAHVRMVLNLSELLALNARVQSSTIFLDQETTLGEILRQLGGDKYLELSIGNLDAFSVLSVAGSKKVRTLGLLSGNDNGAQDEAAKVGEVRTIVNIEVPESIYRPKPEGKVLVDRWILPLLRDQLKNDLRAKWTDRICGALLGASVTIALTLLSGGLSDLFRSNLIIAFFFCVGFLLALALIEKFGRPKHGKSLENIISGLIKDEHDG